MNDLFRKFANKTSGIMGSPWAFIGAVTIIVVWAIAGPIFQYSDGWQLTINTGTTIITFLMVFLIQNTQNRDAQAIQLKLDELLRAVKGARNSLVDLETMSDEELEKLRSEFHALRERNTPLIEDDAQEVESELGRRKHGQNERVESQAANSNKAIER